MEIVNRNPDLLEVTDALSLSRCFSGCLDGRQQQGNQDANNGDNNKKFDKSERKSTTYCAPPILTFTFFMVSSFGKSVNWFYRSARRLTVLIIIWVSGIVKMFPFFPSFFNAKFSTTFLSHVALFRLLF